MARGTVAMITGSLFLNRARAVNIYFLSTQIVSLRQRNRCDNSYENRPKSHLNGQKNPRPNKPHLSSSVGAFVGAFIGAFVGDFEWAFVGEIV